MGGPLGLGDGFSGYSTVLPPPQPEMLMRIEIDKQLSARIRFMATTGENEH